MSERNPRVSIGLPVYNGERYLATALQSLLGQTFVDFEVVISDNASTDGTEAICRRYAERDGRIRYVRHTENRGAIWNFNHAFELARGEYYRWQAHDDVCAPTFLARCVEMLDADPTMVFCHTRKAKIDGEGRVLGVLAQKGSASLGRGRRGAQSYEERIQEGRAAERPHERFRTVLLGPSFCMDCFGLMRASSIRQTRLIQAFYGSEKVFSAELALLGRCGTVPELLFFSRDPDAGTDTRGSAEGQEEYVGTARPRKLSLTRLRLLRGHAGAVWHVRLPAGQRLRCLLAVAEYVVQLPKWKRVLREMLTGAPLASGEQLELIAPPEPLTVDQILAGAGPAGLDGLVGGRAFDE